LKAVLACEVKFEAQARNPVSKVVENAGAVPERWFQAQSCYL
jgi:hypothetical protein